MNPSRKNADPVADPMVDPELEQETEQDESGKTAGPQSPVGLQPQPTASSGDEPRQHPEKNRPDRTTRGQQDREREDATMFGEPLDSRDPQDAATRPANTSRDRGLEPADDGDEKEAADKQS